MKKVIIFCPVCGDVAKVEIIHRDEEYTHRKIICTNCGASSNDEIDFQNGFINSIPLIKQCGGCTYSGACVDDKQEFSCCIKDVTTTDQLRFITNILLGILRNTRTPN